MIFNMVGGGSGLNFKLVGGIAQPSNPKENTIWVDTDREITSWSLSLTEPANAVEGMVWVETMQIGDIGFNALKENAIPMYPMRTAQYVSGVWVTKPSYIFQGDEWARIVVYLLNGSNQCTLITGGWERKTYGSSQRGTWSIDENGLSLNGDSPTLCMGLKGFDPSMLKKFNALRGIAEITDSDTGTIHMGIRSNYSLGSSGVDTDFIVVHTYSQVSTPGTYEFFVDLTGVDSGYPLVTSWEKDITFSKIWFE